MNKNFIFIGDSLISGYGVHINEGWIAKYAENSSFNIINKGINGDTTASMLNRFYNDVEQKNPSKVFIMGGTNDLLCGRTVSSILSNIEEMIIDSPTKDIYIGIPPFIVKQMAEHLFMKSTLYNYCEDSLVILRTALIGLCNKYKIKYIDFYTLTKEKRQDDIYLDGLHLNKNGNELFYNEFIKNL